MGYFFYNFFKLSLNLEQGSCKVCGPAPTPHYMQLCLSLQPGNRAASKSGAFGPHPCPSPASGRGAGVGCFTDFDAVLAWKSSACHTAFGTV